MPIGVTTSNLHAVSVFSVSTSEGRGSLLVCEHFRRQLNPFSITETEIKKANRMSQRYVLYLPPELYVCHAMAAGTEGWMEREVTRRTEELSRTEAIDMTLVFHDVMLDLRRGKREQWREDSRTGAIIKRVFKNRGEMYY